jgi:hypothetical protein
MGIAIALLLAAATPARLPPVEQCGGDPEFDRFRRQLETAVERRDLDKLLPLLAPDIRLSFGTAPADAKFRNFERSGPGGDGLWQESLWGELDEVLHLGCATARNGVGVEYRAWPAMFVTGDELDGFGTWISRPGAVQRTKPNARAPIKQRLPSWTVLEEIGESIMPYLEVRTPKGRTGFVAHNQLRSLIDYRLVAKRQDGRWTITAFIAGD